VSATRAISGREGLLASRRRAAPTQPPPSAPLPLNVVGSIGDAPSFFCGHVQGHIVVAGDGEVLRDDGRAAGAVLAQIVDAAADALAPGAGPKSQVVESLTVTFDPGPVESSPPPRPMPPSGRKKKGAVQRSGAHVRFRTEPELLKES
jgi:hypothetical protein